MSVHFRDPLRRHLTAIAICFLIYCNLIQIVDDDINWMTATLELIELWQVYF